MGKFLKKIKEKEHKEKLSKHPLRNENDEIKKDYLQALVLLANEDDNFSSEEKEFLEFVANLIDIDKSYIEEADKFAADPDENQLFDFIERLKNLDEKVKYIIMVEACVVAFKDDKLDENEEGIIDEYLEILSLQEHKEKILFLAKILNDKDIDNAIVYFLAYPDIYEQFSYMFDILELDVKKEINELYKYEWITWKFNTGSLAGEAVSSKPVTKREVVIMLNYMLLANTIYKVDAQTIQFVIKEEEKKEDKNDLPLIFGSFSGSFSNKGYIIDDKYIVDDINKTNIVFDKLFSYQDDDTFLGAKKGLAILFFNFTDMLFEKSLIKEKVSMVSVNYGYKDKIKLSSDSINLPQTDEIGKNDEKNYIGTYGTSHIKDDLGLSGIYPKKTTFRVMKPSKAEEK